MASPVLSGVDGATFAENTVSATPQVIDADVTFSDADDDFDGGSLVVSGLAPGDRISIQHEGTGAGEIGYDPDTGQVSFGGVVIGLASGGVDGPFTVVFNADADSAAIEALLEHLTYATTVAHPVDERTLEINVTDAAGNDLRGAKGFHEQTGTANPLDDLGAAGSGQTAFGDLDGDGDLDLAIGGLPGEAPRYFENVGTAAAPVFEQRTGAANPLAGLTDGNGVIDFGDLDSDGDLDIVMGGQGDGYLRHYDNVGGAGAPSFVRVLDSSIAQSNQLIDLRPQVVDYDSDGDIDVVVGSSIGVVAVFQNFRTDFALDFDFFGAGTGSLYGIPFGTSTTAALADVDGDGDLDALVGTTDGVLRYFENAGGLVERSGAQNPFDGIDVGTDARPRFVDLDADGDLDLFVSGAGGVLRYYANVAPAPQVVVTLTRVLNPVVGDGTNQTLTGAAGDDLMQGLDGDDLLDAGDGDDVLEGGVGADYLRGGAGADEMFGGVGDDTYVVENADDVTDETGGDGIDLVWSRIDWILGANIENLTLGAAGGDTDGTGNGLNNVVTGNDSDNTLSGLGGADTLVGAGGHDTLYGGDNDDTLDGGVGNDTLFGGDGIDSLIGGAGNDWLEGGAGVGPDGDVMDGGLGNDTYVVDQVFDSVLESIANGGKDTVRSSVDWTLGANLENLVLTGFGAIDGIGNGLRNAITGNDSANWISGGDEVDTLSGAGGDDVILGDDGNDVIDGGAGSDDLEGGAGNDTLHGGDSTDNLWGGDGNDFLYGDDGVDSLIGEAGADYLDGGAGGDLLQGGAGNDTYLIDDTNDGIMESAGGGADLILSSVSLSMQQYVENLTLTGPGDTYGVGNALANVMTGNSGANMLSGWDGADTLSGNDGADTLVGDLGNDVINGGVGDDYILGGAGADRLTGGGGKDGFVFTYEDIQLSSLGGTLERDHILDLNFAEGDHIDLNYIDADATTADVNEAFHFVSKFTRTAGEATLKYVAATNITTLELDVDGDGKADFRLALNGDHSGSTGNEWTGSSDVDGGWFL